MELLLTAEQSLLKDTARRFLTERPVGGKLWLDFAGLGWLAVGLPETYGGLDSSAVECAILAEALGRNLVTEPWVASIVLAAGLLADAGTQKQCDLLLPGVAEGTTRIAFAHGEPDARDDIGHVATSARRAGDGWVLDGRKTMLLAGDIATHFLVSAQAGDGIALFVVGRDLDGLMLDVRRGVDGSAIATFELRQLAVGQSALLTLDGLAKIQLAVDRALAAWCAEAVGVMEMLLEATIAYTRARVQFGRPIAANQVVRHRLADLSVALEEARSVTLKATLSLDAASDVRGRAVAAAKVKVGRSGRLIGEQAVQLHGAMGVTDELAIGTALKRLLTLDLLFGSAETHLRRHAGGSVDAAGINLPLTEAEMQFQAEVRHFIASHLTADLRRAQDLTPSVYADPEVSQAWHRILFEKGWIAPGWPTAFGGPGWSATQRSVFERETSRAGAPLLHPQGLRLVGPVIMKFGTAEQKAFYLPRILSGEDYWCQGYSEPEAGSDLASLKTRAVRDGEFYVVNGSKMWTTHAQHANRMFALVRTSQEARKQQGISFLLIDMDTPGLSLRPIMTIGGDHEVNQVFLDDVRVPIGNLVGSEGEGWSYGKYLLEFERGGAIVSGRLRRGLQKVAQLASDYGTGSDVAERLSEIEIDIDAVEMLELCVLSASRLGENPGSAISSILKLRVSQLYQAIATLALRVIGSDALVWEPQRPLYRLNHDGPLSESALPVTARYLNTRAYTIFGGSAEIQHDIIAKAIIGD